MDRAVIKRAVQNILDRYSVDPNDKNSLTELAMKILDLVKEGDHSPSALRDLVIELVLESTRDNV